MIFIGHVELIWERAIRSGIWYNELFDDMLDDEEIEERCGLVIQAETDVRSVKYKLVFSTFVLLDSRIYSSFPWKRKVEYKA